MSTGHEFVDLGLVIAALCAMVLWIVRGPGRQNKAGDKKARAGHAVWDPDTDAGRRNR